MNKRKARAVKTYMCAHCGLEIATIYDTGDHQVLESRRGKVRAGVAVKIRDPQSHQAIIVCPHCGKETPATWDLRLGSKLRIR